MLTKASSSVFLGCKTLIMRSDIRGVFIVTFAIAALILGSLTSAHALSLPSDLSSVANRTIDGSGNNLITPTYGMAGSPLLRISELAYADSIYLPSGASRPNPRTISNTVVAQSQSVKESTNASDMVWQWGQFLDHDLDLTPTASPAEEFAIPVPECDSVFDPVCSGTKTMTFKRSMHNSGNTVAEPREQINTLTAFIDASNVYGSDNATAQSLRTLSGGKLKTSAGNLLPYDGAGPAYLAGDVRVNEQIFLTAIHTLFVREHNRLAEEVAKKYPIFNDEQIYQYVRKVVGAQMQVITYNEFLPLLIGKNAIPKYTGYKSNVDPSIATEFSTALFRLGHSLLSPEILRVTNAGTVLPVALKDAFFRSDLVPMHDGIDSMLRGLAFQRAEEMDHMIVDAVRNFLFANQGQEFDLAALNIQRGRDHGIADYNTVRAAYGLPRVTSFSEITSDPTAQSALESAYGNVDSIDLWVGAIAEDNVSGAVLGETMRAGLVDQFTRLRDGDRFWYENDIFFKVYKDEMKRVKKTKLADIIRRNTNIGAELQDNVFICAAPKAPFPTNGYNFCN